MIVIGDQLYILVDPLRGYFLKPHSDFAMQANTYRAGESAISDIADENVAKGECACSSLRWYDKVACHQAIKSILNLLQAVFFQHSLQHSRSDRAGRHRGDLDDHTFLWGELIKA